MHLKDYMNPKNIRNFIEGNMNYFKQKTSFFLLEPHIQEQAILRAAACMDCLEVKQCPHCGCSTPGLFYAPKKEDALEKWGEMLDKKEWEEFKTKHELTIPDIDLAALEVEQDFMDGNLGDLPPWEVRQVLSDLYDSFSRQEDETKR